MTEALSSPRRLTPMMQQYMAAKASYPDAIVLFRLGDFYEMFFDDARLASRVLGITLTSRDKDKGEEAVPMAGVPHHAISGYIAKLCEEGYKVALCEQFEDSEKKGTFRRQVSRVITPGMVFDEESLQKHSENFLAALVSDAKGFALAALDISTGRFRATETSDATLLGDELLRIAPRELVFTPDERLAGPMARLKKSRLVEKSPSGRGSLYDQAVELCLLALREALPETPRHLGPAERYEIEQWVLIDETSRRNLELTQTLMGGKREGSLLHHLDRTQTAMGARLLAHWLTTPLRSLAAIRDRQTVIQHWLDHPAQRQTLSAILASLYDLERLNGRLGALQATPRDLSALRDTLGRLPAVKQVVVGGGDGILEGVEQTLPEPLTRLFAALGDFSEIFALLSRALVDSPPVFAKEGGIFRPGFDPAIDELNGLAADGKGFLLALEQRERERTKIASLKIRYNRVFGYAIEITKSQLERVPDNYVRRQTLANAERFVTEELTSYEEKVLHADEKRLELEERRFLELRAGLLDACPALKAAARALAEIDVLLGLATVAAAHDYVRPEIVEEPVMQLQAARHPVVESFVQKQGQAYVPCDIELSDEARLLIVTGPNMAGKSTVLREVAVIQLLAQLGSFVPAKRAKIGLCDRIFTRVGASDNLSQGQSTFMVEMAETAAILRGATAQSLVIVDEIGRGTSTFDGLSLAWAVAEYLHDVVQCRGLFATHYHELIELSVDCPRVRNFHMAVKEWNGQVVFLRELRAGGTSRSYGVEVARLAGLPKSVLARANEILAELEAQRHGPAAGPSGRAPAAQLQLFVPVADKASPILRQLKALELERLTPIEALNILARLVKQLS